MTLSDVKMYLFGFTVFAWIFERIASALDWTPMITNILTWIVIISWLVLVTVHLIFLRPRKRYQWLMVFGFGAGGGMAIATLMIWSKASAWEPALTWCSVVSVLGVILGFGCAHSIAESAERFWPRTTNALSRGAERRH